MIPLPSGVRVWLATGHTDMRRGMNGLALQIQETLRRDPYSGHLFVFRGRRGHPATFNIPIELRDHRLPMASPPRQDAAGRAVEQSRRGADRPR
jgi:IS66 Orf2 like protein